MDYSKYTTYLCFYSSVQKVSEYTGHSTGEELTKAHEALGKVIFAKAQEYNVKEQEVSTCVIKVPWHPVIKTCTHVETVDFYDSAMYKIELQQMPFNDGELEIKCIKVR
ncbi:hypothetical protein R2E40_10110 [Aeromonas sp. CD]|uniref:hypothetical protein n=1 Tax=Aeromonas sp. CD TaxID=3080830 RepID=UPI0029665F17|nr:hypothetical protein [Aeromonas sp. CD]WOX54442.1 hypothetical protein R2E40_10110 [Aeromonas sp. CD]